MKSILGALGFWGPKAVAYLCLMGKSAPVCRNRFIIRITDRNRKQENKQVFLTKFADVRWHKDYLCYETICTTTAQKHKLIQTLVYMCIRSIASNIHSVNIRVSFGQKVWFSPAVSIRSGLSCLDEVFSVRSWIIKRVSAGAVLFFCFYPLQWPK